MVNTLVLYEGKYGTAKQVAGNIGYIVGNTKVAGVEDAPSNLEAYQNVILVYSFYGYDTLKQTKPYVVKMKEQLKHKKIGVTGIGLAQSDLKNYMKLLSGDIVVPEEMTYFVGGELRLNKLTKEDYETLEKFTKKVNMPFKDMGTLNLQEVAQVGESFKKQLTVIEKPMPKEQLSAEIESFIKAHNMLALATGSGMDVRCSPVEYVYYNGCFYIITEGGLKFRGLTQNKKVSFGIYDPYKGMKDLGGLQVTAKAEMVPVLSEEYKAVMTQRGIQLAALEKLPITLYMVKIVPETFEFLYSSLIQSGYSTKQIL